MKFHLGVYSIFLNVKCKNKHNIVFPMLYLYANDFIYLSYTCCGLTCVTLDLASFTLLYAKSYMN